MVSTTGVGCGRDTMRLGCVFHLPDEVGRFEPVLRRLPGAEAVLGRGRWLAARGDSRALVRQALRARGWRVLDQPTGDFDLLLTGGAACADGLRPWLAPGGGVVLWHEPALPSRPLLQADEEDADPRGPGASLVRRVAVARPEGVGSLRADVRAEISVTGDPALDTDPAAAARARQLLALGGERPVGLVVSGTALAADGWARAIAALRTNLELIVAPTIDLALDGHWPRAWQGPGLRLAPCDGQRNWGELVAVADLLLLGPDAHAAWLERAGRPYLRLGRPTRPDPVEGCLGLVEEPDRLGRAVGAALRSACRPPSFDDRGAIDRLGRCVLETASAERADVILHAGALPLRNGVS